MKEARPRESIFQKKRRSKGKDKEKQHRYPSSYCHKHDAVLSDVELNISRHNTRMSRAKGSLDTSTKTRLGFGPATKHCREVSREAKIPKTKPPDSVKSMTGPDRLARLMNSRSLRTWSRGSDSQRVMLKNQEYPGGWNEESSDEICIVTLCRRRIILRTSTKATWAVYPTTCTGRSISHAARQAERQPEE
ncbi:MAG: hypothetical protein QOJ42_5634 [Acidobacteriaceae bacterium]|nr:hypothetical protein [Acidobacteriaceae bacterium]